MQITSGCGKGGFTPEHRRPAASTPAPAHFTPFTLTLTRQDGEANPADARRPPAPGPAGKARRRPALPRGRRGRPAPARPPRRSAASPPPAGVGGAPLWIPQPGKAPTAVYLAGPYKGAPYSIVAVVPAQAGPFDLGTVVNRAGDPRRPRNRPWRRSPPTPCPRSSKASRSPTARSTSTSTGPNSPSTRPAASRSRSPPRSPPPTAPPPTPPTASRRPTAPSSPTRPKLKLAFKGTTKRTGNPAVRAILTQKPHQANTAKAVGDVLPGLGVHRQRPHQQPLHPGPVRRRTPARRARSSARPRAITPLLDEPLEGPGLLPLQRRRPRTPRPRRRPARPDPRHPGRLHRLGPKGTETARVRTRFLERPRRPGHQVHDEPLRRQAGPARKQPGPLPGRNRATVRMAAQNGKRHNSQTPVGEELAGSRASGKDGRSSPGVSRLGLRLSAGQRSDCGRAIGSHASHR